MVKPIKTNNTYNLIFVIAGIVTSIFYIIFINNVSLDNDTVYALTYIPLAIFALIYGYGLLRIGKNKSKEFAKVSIPVSIFIMLLTMYAYLNSGFYL
jgi:hypothetical protein